jgi:hypothetical protein
MARGMRTRRRSGGQGRGPAVALAALGVALISGVAALFWFAGKAESNPPEMREIRMEALNVGAP